MKISGDFLFRHAKIIALAIVLICVLAVSLQSYLLEPNPLPVEGTFITHYNNFTIFRQAFFHLVQGQDLYKPWPAEHWDLFKYSPAFALLMAPLAAMPVFLGLLFWNLINATVLFFAFWKIPLRSDKIRLLALGFILIEMITSLQNSQSNCLITGLILFGFLSMEKRRIWLASLLIVLSAFIKIFGLMAVFLFLLYPGKIKALLYTILWTALLVILPLVVIPPLQLIALYKSWYLMLAQDHSASFGLSVFGWLHSWFGIEGYKNLILLAGVLVFLLPLLKFRQFRESRFRLFFLSGILLWVVLFNHKAESPTYIIAVTGVTIWFFIQEFRIGNLILLMLVFVFTVLSPTDIFPRNTFVEAWCLKAVPCILVWMKLTFDMLTTGNRSGFLIKAADREDTNPS
jgi:hypothetical protein